MESLKWVTALLSTSAVKGHGVSFPKLDLPDELWQNRMTQRKSKKLPSKQEKACDKLKPCFPVDAMYYWVSAKSGWVLHVG